MHGLGETGKMMEWGTGRGRWSGGEIKREALVMDGPHVVRRRAARAAVDVGNTGSTGDALARVVADGEQLETLTIPMADRFSSVGHGGWEMLADGVLG